MVIFTGRGGTDSIPTPPKKAVAAAASEPSWVTSTKAFCTASSIQSSSTGKPKSLSAMGVKSAFLRSQMLPLSSLPQLPRRRLEQYQDRDNCQGQGGGEDYRACN